MLPDAYFFGTQEVQVFRPEKRDSRGTEILVYPKDPTHTIGGCIVTPSSSSGFDDKGDRELHVVYRYMVYMPPDADIEPGDRILWDGIMWDIDGGPLKWPDSVGLGHITCHLTKQEG